MAWCLALCGFDDVDVTAVMDGSAAHVLGGGGRMYYSEYLVRIYLVPNVADFESKTGPADVFG